MSNVCKAIQLLMRSIHKCFALYSHNNCVEQCHFLQRDNNVGSTIIVTDIVTWLQKVHHAKKYKSLSFIFGLFETVPEIRISSKYFMP